MIRNKNIDMEDIKTMYVRESGWIEVKSVEEIYFTIGESSNPRAGKKAWEVVTLTGETLTLTPAMVEAVTV